MIKVIFQCIVAVAIINLAISIYPEIRQWMHDFIMWLLSFGDWGVIAFFSIVLVSFINLFK